MTHQLLPHQDILTPPSFAPKETAEFINGYIDSSNCEFLLIDISFMNIIDSCYVSALCSAKHYIKYPAGKISWLVSNELITELNADKNLGNAEYLIS